MKTCHILKTEIPELVKYLRESFQVLGPKKTVKTPVFAEICDPSEMVLDYTTSIMPPKKFFMPIKETLLKFDLAAQKAEVPPPVKQQRVLLGVHPCDMAGIILLDWAFTKGQPESNWIERRKATTIFGIAQIPDEYCFSKAIDFNNPEKGFDGFFFDNGEYYLVAIYTEKGEEALKGFKGATSATSADLERGRANFDRVSSKQTLKLDAPLSEISTILLGADKYPEWEEIAKHCFSCGSCTNVCPTCFCFDVEDGVDLSLNSGSRMRKWDSCQLYEFTTVAGGHTFRNKREDRVRQRIYRKYLYLGKMDIPQYPFCTGCGRCIRTCTAGIDIVKMINNVCRQSLVGE
jgi:sulfhydrogenase subunit beta (sulfur reductase)